MTEFRSQDVTRRAEPPGVSFTPMEVLVICGVMLLLLGGVQGCSSPTAPADSIQFSATDDDRTGQELGPNAMAGRRMLWVESKGVYCSTRCYDADGAYRALLDRYRSAGAEVDVTHADPVRAEDVAGYDVVWVALPSNWERPFFAEEAKVLDEFVQDGGGVMILSDGLLAPNHNLTAIADVFGFGFGESACDFWARTTHPTFNDEILLLSGAGAVSGARTWAQDPSSDNAVGVLAAKGAGRVLALGDASAFTASMLNWPGSANGIVADTAVDWLLGFDRCAPDDSPALDNLL